MTIRIQIRRDTAANWVSANPTLRAGEIGIETDTLKMKVGNGSSTWTQITSYMNTVPSDLNTTLNGYLEVTDLNDTVAALNGVQNLVIPNDSIIFEGATEDSYELTLQATDPTADRTITLPDVSGTVITTGDTGTVTNSMLAGSIANDKLTNSAITINGTSTSLGGTRTLGTDDISEGSTNKYYTDERAQDAVAAALSAGTHTNISVSYNDETNAISLTGATTYSNEDAVDAVAAALAAGTHTNISVSYDDSGNAISLTGAVTYTDENAQDAVGNAVGNGLDYDDNTGAISVDPSEFALSTVGSPTADVSLANYKITNLAAPTSANDAANKAYVDNTTAGLNFHAAVHAATTANLDATYNNGTSGVGATLTANANGALVVDGHTLSVDERVLVKNQTTGFQNGLYVVTATGDGSNPYILTRATDADNSPAGEIAYGDFTFVQTGSTNAGYGYIVNTTGTITIGTTAISYVQFNAGQTVIAGNGLTESSPGTLAINTAVTADLSTAQTLTNKTISGSSNTLSSIPNSALTNSSITINGSAVSLGGSTTISVPGAATPTLEGLLFGSSSSSVNTSTSVGYQAGNVAGATTTNTFFGYQAGPINTTGFSNSIMGYRAGYLNVTGQRNTFVGEASGYSNTSNYNTYIGTKAGHQTTTASGNVAIGYEAIGSAATGTTRDNGGGNVAVGQSALSKLTGANAYQNIGIGNLAGIEATTGQRSVYIGNWAGGIGTALTGSNNILIGHNSAPSSASVSNEITLGDANITTFRIPGLSLTATTANPIVQLTSTQTLTNKTISGSSNTLSNIPNNALTNSSITVNGSAVSLGGSVTIDALPSQTGNSGKYLTTNGSTASWASLVVPITTGTATITADTATTIDTNALAGFTSIEYMISLKQGSKIRTSKVVLQTDGTSVDMTEFAITETGGTMSGVVVSATTSGSDAILQVTVTDASSTNVTVKFSEVKL